jgi:fatty-acyl-CoA synthase
VKRRVGASFSGDDRRAYCRGRIADFKVPHYLRFTGEFPTTVTGKIQRLTQIFHRVVAGGVGVVG